MPGISDRRSKLPFPERVPAREFHESLPTDVTAAGEAEIDFANADLGTIRWCCLDNEVSGGCEKHFICVLHLIFLGFSRFMRGETSSITRDTWR